MKIILKEIIFFIMIIFAVYGSFTFLRYFWHIQHNQGRSYNLIPFEVQDPVIVYRKT